MGSGSENPDNSEKKLTRGQRLWGRLLEARKTAPVSQWRAKLLTDSWKETEGLPLDLRWAKSFARSLSN